MSEWLNFVKAYALKNNIPYKQALKDASPSYKTRNEKPVEPEIIPTTEPTSEGRLDRERSLSKPKRKNAKKDKLIK
jgi:hypothetical protein